MKKLSTWAIILIAVICSVHIVQERWIGDNKKAWEGCISTDGFGYYAYLPYTFIYHKADIKSDMDAIKKLHPEIRTESLYEWTSIVDGKQIDKYFVGVAVLLSPFFLIAYAISSIMGYDPIGGYGHVFQCSVSIAALFYVLLGLIFIRKLLREYDISEAVISIALLVVVFGTNLFYYVTMEPYLSHNYSFGLTAIFLFYAKRSIDTYRTKYLIYTAIVFALLVIIRPPNALSILIIPFLCGSVKQTKEFFVNVFKFKTIIVLALVALSIVCIQLYTYYAETGHPFIWSYHGEGFDFAHAQIGNVLFSYRKGWLLYTPIMLLIIAGGLMFFLRKNIFQFFSFVLFAGVVIYVLSSWVGWWYGASISQRPFIDFYPHFILVFALWFNQLKSWWIRVPVYILLPLLTALNLIQIYQYENCIITMDNMNKDRYWKVFLQTGDKYKWLYNLVGETSASDFVFFENKTAFNDFEHNTWGSDKNVTYTYAHSGDCSSFASEKRQYGPLFVDTVSSLPHTGKPLVVYAKMQMYVTDFDNDPMVVVCIQEKGKQPYFWRGARVWGQIYKINTWTTVECFCPLPDSFINKDDILSVFVYDTKGIVYVDDEQIKFGVYK